MDGVVDFLRRNRDLIWKIAVAAALLGMFWQQIQGLDSWFVGSDVLDPNAGFFKSGDGLYEWLHLNYFLDPYLAALVFGLLVGRWEATKVAVLGFFTGLVVVTGPILTGSQLRNTRGDFESYLLHTLQWTWMLGLIALGVFIGRKLGDPFDELDEPAI